MVCLHKSTVLQVFFENNLHIYRIQCVAKLQNYALILSANKIELHNKTNTILFFYLCKIIKHLESMENPCKESLRFNYSDIFFSYFINNDVSCTHKAHNHAMTYVYSGEMLLEEGNRKITVRKGECVFIRRDIRVSMIKRPYGNEQYSGIFIMFNRDLLRNLYRKFNKKNLPEDLPKLKQSVIKLPSTTEIESLFSSMVPYFDPSIKPKDEFMQLKLVESVYTLLDIDKRFYPTLFDFTEPWKIDILDFLDKNYMFDLSMEEIAGFTGRSLATFKRDFKKVSDLPPEKWLINKRLRIAYDKIRNESQKVSDVYLEVGFKNLSHFSSAFKKQFGYSPTSAN